MISKEKLATLICEIKNKLKLSNEKLFEQLDILNDLMDMQETLEFHLNNLEEELEYNELIDEDKELYKGKDKKN